MPSTAEPSVAQTFVVVATIRNDTNFAELGALRADEHKQLAALQSEGRIGAHHIALTRRTVFLEVMAPDEEQVIKTLATLPFSKFFDVDIYPTAAPEPTDG